MHIKSIASAAAIALAAGIGSAGAGEDFTILSGLDASPLSDLESARTRGTDFLTTGAGNGIVLLSVPVVLTARLPLVAPVIRDLGGGLFTINNQTVNVTKD